MGSAVTFPLQCIIFTMFAVAAVIISRKQSVNEKHIVDACREVRVYGDDIIVPVSSYPVLVSMLSACFLKVNESKSFVNGPFRESCGMDAMDGIDITPAYFLQGYEPNSPESVMSVVESSNNFHLKGMWRTANYILLLIPYSVRRLIPSYGPSLWPSVKTLADTYGPGFSLATASYSSGYRATGKTRWNSDLHREEVRVLDLLTKIRYSVPEGEAALFQFFTESTGPYTKWGDPTEVKELGQGQQPVHQLVKRWVPTISVGEEPVTSVLAPFKAG